MDTRRNNVAAAAVPPEEKIKKKSIQSHQLFWKILTFLLSQASLEELFPVPEERFRELTARSVPRVHYG